MGGKGKPRKKRIKQLKEGYLQARDLSASDKNHLVIKSFMDYFGKWKILVTLLAIFGFALGIFVVVDRMFFHEAPVLLPEPEPYMHKFATDKVGFKSPRKVLTINTPELRLLVQDAIEKGWVSNGFDLDPLKGEGLYLIEYSNLTLQTTVRKSDINKMTLVPLDEPELNESDPLLSLDSMAYFGPRALQTIRSETMLEIMSKAENIRGKEYMEVGGVLSLNSDGTSLPYGKDSAESNFERIFERILPISEGLPYLRAQVDINNPNAEELLKEFQESQEQG